jgi:hypothetical protein
MRKNRRGPRTAALLAAAMMSLPAGCGADEATTPGPTTTAEATTGVALHAELRRNRGDEGKRIIQVTMTNTGAEPLVVHELVLDAPHFPAVSPTPKGSTVWPGIPLDLPIPYGTPDCKEKSTATEDQDRGAGVRIRVGPTAGPEHDVRLVVDPALLDRLLTAECEQVALARAVTVSFSESWTRGTRNDLPALDGRLVLVRGDAVGPVAVTDLDGSTLFLLNTAAVPPPLPLVMAADADRAEMAIQVTAKSCDAHVRSQSQRPYELSIFVSVDGAEPKFVAPAVDPSAQASMQEVIAATCGT